MPKLNTITRVDRSRLYTAPSFSSSHRSGFPGARPKGCADSCCGRRSPPPAREGLGVSPLKYFWKLHSRQEAQLSQRDCAMLRVIQYFAKSVKVMHLRSF